MKVTTESLAAAGITGGAAVFLMFALVMFVLAVNLGIFALVGVVLAYLWNTLLLPNVDADLPIVLWWQAALAFLGARMLLGLLKN